SSATLLILFYLFTFASALVLVLSCSRSSADICTTLILSTRLASSLRSQFLLATDQHIFKAVSPRGDCYVSVYFYLDNAPRADRVTNHLL
ncbi:hypothetical protein V8E53_000911, partial [Lactarius tabidus]